MAISGTTAIVGAYLDHDVAPSSGSAYIFDTTTGQQLFKLTAADSAAGDRFGNTVAISGGSIIVGAWGNDDAGSNTGSAYIFGTTTPCLADLTGDGLLDFLDVSLFITYFLAGNPITDFNGDGVFNFFDITIFLHAFNAGCP